MRGILEILAMEQELRAEQVRAEVTALVEEGRRLADKGKAAEAAQQFQASLLRMPNRAASLLGAARAAAKAGDQEAARRHYATLAEVWKDADPSLPELAEVRTYLSGVPAR